MRASRRPPANLNGFKRPIGSENKKISQPSKGPLSPLSVNAIDERRIRNFNIRPTNDKDSSTDATLISGRKGPGIAPEDSLSPTTCNGSHRVVWSNAAYSRESIIEISDSIKEGKEDDSQAKYKEFPSNHAIAVHEITVDANSSKENENSDVESTASTWYTPIATHGSTSDKKRAVHISNTGKKGVQSTRKALFCLGYLDSQAVTDARHNRSSVEEDETTGKIRTTHVKNDNIDSGIEEIEKEIIRLTQKLSELKLQKANSATTLPQNLEGVSRAVDAHHEHIDKNIVKSTSDEVVTKHSPQEQSAEKKKRGRIVSSKFLQSDSRSQLKSEQKAAETNSTRKNSGIQNYSQIQRRAVSLVSSGPPLRKIPSKVNHVREEKREELKDKIDRKFNPQKADVSKDAFGEVGSSGKHDRRETECRSPISNPNFHRSIEKRLDFSTKDVGLGEKNIEQSLPMNLEGNQWLHENGKRPSDEPDKRKSRSVSCGDIVDSCVRVQSSQQASKLSPAMKNARFVPSRYGQIVTPHRDVSSITKSPKNLTSLRNAHGKRISAEVEDEDEKCRLGRNSVKRPAVGGIASSPSVKGFAVRDGYPVRSGLTPNSKTPQGPTARIELNKTPCSSKGSKPTCRPGRVVPARHGTKVSKQQSISTNEKELSQRSLAIKAEGSFKKPSDPFPQNLRGRMSSKNQGKLPEVYTKQGSSVVFPPRDSLEPERMKLPKISTFRFNAVSPRDSGCVKRVVDQIGKHPFFSSDGMESADFMDKRSGLVVAKASRAEIDEIKQILSFENETDTMDLQGFWHVVDAA